MLRKMTVLSLLAVLLLTGCGHNSLVMQYADTDDINWLDSEQDIMKEQDRLPKEDSGKWSYREENISALVDMEKRIKENCENDGTEITISDRTEGRNASANMWAQHRVLGNDPKKEKVTGLDIKLEMRDKETMLENCKKIAEIGFDCLRNYSSGDVSMIQKGCKIETYSPEEDEEADDENYYSIEIGVPGMLAYGPERYFDLFDACVDSGLYIQEFICCGGAVDGIVLSGNDLFMNAYVKDGKVLEMAAERYNWKSGNFLDEKDKAGFVEILSRMCGDRNEAASVLKDLKEDGKSVGMLGGRKWNFRITHYEEAYFHIE